MPSTSVWITGYGALLLLCNAMDRFNVAGAGLNGQTMVSGWSAGLLMVAAGLASSQGRRSLRLGGLYVGMLLPLALAGIYAWRGSEMWRSGASSRGPATFISLLALASIGVVWAAAGSRPREGIASRGYAVAISHPDPAPKDTPDRHAAVEQHRRSQAG